MIEISTLTINHRTQPSNYLTIAMESEIQVLVLKGVKHKDIAHNLGISSSLVYSICPKGSGHGRSQQIDRKEVIRRVVNEQKYVDIASDMGIALSSVYKICPKTTWKKRRSKTKRTYRRRKTGSAFSIIVHY